MRKEALRRIFAATPSSIEILVVLLATTTEQVAGSIREMLLAKWQETKNIARRKSLRLRACDTGVAP